MSRRAYHRYDEPQVNEWRSLAVKNVTKSCTVEFPSCKDLYNGVRGMKSRTFSLSKSKASMHATMNHCPKRSTSGDIGRVYRRLKQTYRTHSRTTLKPSSESSPRDQEGYDGDRELPPVATHSGDWDPVAIQVQRLK